MCIRDRAPHDAHVQQSVQDMQLAAHACYSAAMRDNNLGRARECLDAWRQLAPNEPAVLPAQRRLAERWLAVGDERLRAGDVRGARTAPVSYTHLDVYKRQGVRRCIRR